MVARVSASIAIGGRLQSSMLGPFTSLISAYGLSLEWDGAPFTPSQCTTGSPLVLMAREVAFGNFDGLEDFCMAEALPFVRWSGGCDAFSSVRAVFDGSRDIRYYAVDETDDLLLDRGLAMELGSFEAIRRWFDTADFAVPPLIVVQDGQEEPQGTEGG